MGKARTAPRHGARWWQLILAGLAHALLAGASLPPLSVWPAALLAVCPLVWAGCHASLRPARAAILTGLGVLPLWALQHLWIIDITAAGYGPMAVYLTIYPALFVWLIAMARRVDWPIPMSVVAGFGWVGIEVLRADVVLTGYAFALLGHPLIEIAALAMPAALLGAPIISMLAAALSGSVADAAGWSGLSRRTGGIGAAACVLLWAVLSTLGTLTSRPGETFAYRVAVVQSNVPQDNKVAWTMEQRLSDFRTLVQMTRQAASASPQPDLILWPETMFPGQALNTGAIAAQRDAGLFYRVDETTFPGGRVPGTYFADELLSLQAGLNIPMLVGSIAIDGLRYREDNGRIVDDYDAKYNSVLLLSGVGLPPTFVGPVAPLYPGPLTPGEQARYDKVDLTPFGEVIPYLWRWPQAQAAVLDLGAQGMSFDLRFGATVGPMPVPVPSIIGESRPTRIRVAAPICFEVTRGEHVRQLTRGEPDGPAGLIVNLSNDGWFGDFNHGREKHLLAARWRCVELGLPMVRAVNTGISAIIDARGRVQVAGPAAPGGPSRVEGVMPGVVRVETDPGRTVFARIGMLPWLIISGLTLLAFPVLLIRRRALARLGG